MSFIGNRLIFVPALDHAHSKTVNDVVILANGGVVYAFGAVVTGSFHGLTCFCAMAGRIQDHNNRAVGSIIQANSFVRVGPSLSGAI